MRPSRLIVVALALVALMAAGCARHPPVTPQVDTTASTPLAMAPEEAPYSLDSADRLRVVVFGQEGLSGSYSVDASGNITMPLIGAVHARGTSPASLSRTIADKLKQGYIREPHVAVEIEAYRPFFILGEVTTPGQYAYVPNMSVENAVAIAGGYTPRAQRRTIVLSRTIDGIPTRGPVPPDTAVRPGDTIVVQERWF